jgi:hypothetical protein
MLLVQLHVQNVLLDQNSYILLIILVWQLVLTNIMLILIQEFHYVLHVTQLVYGVMVEPIQIVLNVRKILDIYTTNNVC